MSGWHDRVNWWYGPGRCEGCGVRPNVTHLLGCSFAVTVIDADEFAVAHDDPVWAEFCALADTYVAEIEEQG